jgi:hypothetical protein
MRGILRKFSRKDMEAGIRMAAHRRLYFAAYLILLSQRRITMKFNRSLHVRLVLLISLMASLTVLSGKIQADTGACNGGTVSLPFTDVPSSNSFFCQIAQAYFSGLTNGTSATTYAPTQTVTREQMAAFITRTMDQSLKRGSKRAVTEKWWTPQTANNVTLTHVPSGPREVKFDGTDLWVACFDSDSVRRIRPSDGKVLETWTGAADAYGILCAMGRVFVTGNTNPGRLYMIDPTQPAGAVTVLNTSLGAGPQSIVFDGERIWTANGNSVSIVSLNPTTVTTVTTGFSNLDGMLYDGTNIWVTDNGADSLLKLNANGSIAQTITVGDGPKFPVFDGANIWVPNSNRDNVTVVRVKDAAGTSLTTALVLATLPGNGLDFPYMAAFDGERILVANFGSDSVSLWKAASLTPLGTFAIGDGTLPSRACSDGLNFWITLAGSNMLARF